jgi:galactose mutarotase-like enzyme
MFDNDAIFLSRVPERVRLESEKSSRFVEMTYPDFPYLGLWHKPKSDAPYVCIEPWCGLPTFDGEIEDFATKCDMFRILPDAEKTLAYSILIG